MSTERILERLQINPDLVTNSDDEGLDITPDDRGYDDDGDIPTPVSFASFFDSPEFMPGEDPEVLDDELILDDPGNEEMQGEITPAALGA